MTFTKKLMKIFYPLQVFYPSQVGGPANTVYWITKTLLQHGIEPIIVASDDGIRGKLPVNTWVDTDGGRAIYVRTRYKNWPLLTTLVSLASFSRADIVHASSIFLPTAFVTVLAARFLRKKVLWSIHGELDPLTLKNLSPIRKRLILWLVRNMVGDYAVYHSTCDEETVYARRVFGRAANIVQIPNYIELPPACVRVPSDYFLYIGRIHPKKGIDNLMHALALSDNFLESDMVLKIAGSGDRESVHSLQVLIQNLKLEDKVVFVGQVEGESKEQLLADAYFTIMPSHTENFGVVVLESLSQNTPVIASKGTPWKSLEDEGIGFWIDNAPDEIGRTIDKVLKMSEREYEGFRKRGREFVQREFDIQKHVGKWIKLYRSLGYKGSDSPKL